VKSGSRRHGSPRLALAPGWRPIARLCAWQGNLAAAAQWAQGCAFAGESELGYVQHLTLIRLRLAQYDNAPDGHLLEEANEALAGLLPAVEARGWMRYVIGCLTLQALTDQRRADRAGARSALERALRLAEPEGYIRMFVDEGAPLASPIKRSPIDSSSPSARSRSTSIISTASSTYRAAPRRSYARASTISCNY
jgi:LuxR family transcriptional regulator, maltose regulon positive regulatory protein